jgi:hypothetical protein
MASIGGAVSAIAVLVSLLFLSLQIRQEEKNQRALIQQGRAGRTADIAMRLMAADFAEVYNRGMNGDSDLSIIQLVQFMGYCRAVFLGAEDSFLQHRESLLGELAFIGFITSLRAFFMSGVRTIWKITRSWYGPEFEMFMDKIVKETSDHPRIDQLIQWKTFLLAENGNHIAS